MTNEVVSNAGATDAYSTADAIATFLREGNATFDFKRNYNGSGVAQQADITYDLIESSTGRYLLRIHHSIRHNG